MVKWDVNTDPSFNIKDGFSETTMNITTVSRCPLDLRVFVITVHTHVVIKSHCASVTPYDDINVEVVYKIQTSFIP